MERKLQERMVGAGVLVIALVIIGPMLLDSRSGSDVTEDTVPGQRSEELRTHTFRLDESREQQAATRLTRQPQPSASPSVNIPGPPQAERPAVSETNSPPPPATGNAGAAAAPAAQSGSRPAQKPVATPPAPATGEWLVQVGTFGQKDNADRLVARLKQRGFPAFVSPTTRNGKTLYRVRVGPAGTREAASDVAERLAAAGHPGQVVR
jgi:DedD protein